MKTRICDLCQRPHATIVAKAKEWRGNYAYGVTYRYDICDICWERIKKEVQRGQN